MTAYYYSKSPAHLISFFQLLYYNIILISCLQWGTNVWLKERQVTVGFSKSISGSEIICIFFFAWLYATYEYDLSRDIE